VVQKPLLGVNTATRASAAAGIGCPSMGAAGGSWPGAGAAKGDKGAAGAAGAALGAGTVISVPQEHFACLPANESSIV